MKHPTMTDHGILPREAFLTYRTGDEIVHHSMFANHMSIEAACTDKSLAT